MQSRGRSARSLLIVVGAVAAASSYASAGLFDAPSAQARSTATFDRTFVCTVPVWGGIREAKLRGRAGVRARPGVWQSLPYASLTPGSPYESLVGVAAGAPLPGGLDATVWIYTNLCRRTNVLVPLSPEGLDGRAASPFGDSYSCEAPKEIFLRVRATATGSVALKTRRIGGKPALTARVPLTRAEMAARTRSGRMIAYADVRGGGSARLFTEPNCYSD